MEVKVYSTTGDIVGKTELPDEIFRHPIRPVTVAEAIRMYEMNQHQFTACKKTRGEVSGSGRKPWPQKHTGRARQGSIRAPHWRGGGVVFGPKPRNVHYRLPQKKLRIALLSVLSQRASEGRIMVIDDIPITYPKTKEFVKILKNLGWNEEHPERYLFVVDKIDEAVFRSMRNLRKVDMREAYKINAFDVLLAKRIVFTLKGLEALKNRLLEKRAAMVGVEE